MKIGILIMSIIEVVLAIVFLVSGEMEFACLAVILAELFNIEYKIEKMEEK